MTDCCERRGAEALFVLQEGMEGAMHVAINARPCKVQQQHASLAAAASLTRVCTMLTRSAEMARETTSQLLSGISAVTSSATRILSAFGTGDNPASLPPATDELPVANADDTVQIQLPSPPAELSSAAACHTFLESLPGGSEAIEQVATRAATFADDAACHRIRPELAGPDLHSIVVGIALALTRKWPQTADGYDGKPHGIAKHWSLLQAISRCCMSLQRRICVLRRARWLGGARHRKPTCKACSRGRVPGACAALCPGGCCTASAVLRASCRRAQRLAALQLDGASSRGAQGDEVVLV